MRCCILLKVRSFLDEPCANYEELTHKVRTLSDIMRFPFRVSFCAQFFQ
jgi:hypothetical protein